MYDFSDWFSQFRFYAQDAGSIREERERKRKEDLINQMQEALNRNKNSSKLKIIVDKPKQTIDETIASQFIYAEDYRRKHKNDLYLHACFAKYNENSDSFYCVRCKTIHINEEKYDVFRHRFHYTIPIETIQFEMI